LQFIGIYKINTIYQIKKGKKQNLKHRKRGLHKKRSKIVKKRSIEKCLAILNQNTEFDHWKIDLMVEGR